MITIKEMAEMLGISTTTVSNVINGKTSEVSQKTAEKVQKLLDEYGYVPNMSAKNLAQNHSRLIGIVLKGRKDKYENIFADFEKKASDASIVVFASGDPLFFGFANTVKRKLPDAKIQIGRASCRERV